MLVKFLNEEVVTMIQKSVRHAKCSFLFQPVVMIILSIAYIIYIPAHNKINMLVEIASLC